MEKTITGIVQCNEQVLNFYGENYKFTFMSTDGKMHSVKAIDGFIFGYTHERRRIAIYADDAKISVVGKGTLNTGSYIISTSNTYEQELGMYKAIIFSGGTINSLAMPYGYEQEHLDDGNILLRHKDDSKEYTFKINEQVCKVSIFSSSSTHLGIDGLKIKNDTMNFMIEFPEEQPLKKIYEHIAKIKELLAFMTFRRNVGFDEIRLFQYDERFENRLMAVAKVYIKEKEDFTKKSIWENIGFGDLGESMENMLELIFNSEDNKPSLVLGFIPQNDSNINIMTNMKLREICSALECELSFINDIKSEENENLKSLIGELKRIIKEHRKSSDALTQKTYDFIFSSMSHWSLSASDKIIELYHRYEQQMQLLNSESINLTDEMIEEFVKYRNKITHGSYQVLNYNVAITAHVLSGLVYCCLLKRIGVSDVRILEWCSTKILK